MSILTADPVEVMTKTRLSLIFEGYVFFAAMAFHLIPVQVEDEATAKRIWRGQPPTMATDGKHMFYHRDFFKTLNPTHGFKQLMGVVAHEALHYGLGHMFRIGERDPVLWNIACVPAGTVISLANGGRKLVENISPGDSLYACGTSLAIALVKSKSKRMLRLTMSSGHILECTHEHKVLTPQGFVEAGSLRVGGQAYVDPSFNQKRAPHGGARKVKARDLPGAEDYISPIRQHIDAQEDKVRLSTGAQRASGGVVVKNGHSLSRWAGGRGGYRFFHEADGEGETVSHPYTTHRQHLPRHDAVDQEPRVHAIHVQEQLWRSLLQSVRRWWDQRSGYPGAYAVPDNQEAASGMLLALSRAAESSRSQIPSLIGDGVAGGGGQAFEQARIEQIEDGAVQECYDIVTTGGHYTANGVVVHNCDISINFHIKAAGMVLPDDHIHQNDPKVRDMFRPLPKGVTWDEVAGQWDAEKIFNHFDKDKCGGSKQRMPQWGIVIKPQTGEGGGNGDATEAEMKGLEGRARDAMVQSAASASLAGKMPGSLQGVMDEMLKPQVDWRAVMQRFISQSVPFDYTWRKPGRRHMHRGMYMPSVKKQNFGTLVVINDTSGSVSDNEQKHFVGEVNAISTMFDFAEIITIPCDYAVHESGIRRYKRGEPITSLRVDGRGGTSFKPPFAWLANHPDIKPSRVIYLTDLEGDFPAEYEVPTLWVATTKHKAPWGETVHINVGRGR